MNDPASNSTDSINPRIEQLTAGLLPDGKRVRVGLILNDASSRPTIDFILLDQHQEEITRSTIIGMFSTTVTFTLHLVNHSSALPFFVRAAVYVNESQLVDEKLVLVEKAI